MSPSGNEGIHEPLDAFGVDRCSKPRVMNQKCCAEHETFERIDWIIRAADRRGNMPELMNMADVMDCKALAIFGNVGQEFGYVPFQFIECHFKPVASRARAMPEFG